MITASQIQQQVIYAKANKTYQLFVQAGQTYNVPFTLLLAIASRESGIGSNSYYQNNSHIGSDGESVGIMQLNYNYLPNYITDWAYDDKANINEAAKELAGYIRTFNGSYQKALDAYNAGVGSVQSALSSGKNPDSVTTDGNYGSNVLARMQLLNSIIYPGQSNLSTGSYVSVPLRSTSSKSFLIPGIIGGTLILGIIIYHFTT